MRTTSLDQQIQSAIQDFATSLSSMVKAAALESVHSALGGVAPNGAARRSAGRPAGSRNTTVSPTSRGGKRVRRSSEDLGSMGDKILAHVGANPGARADQIASGLGLTTKDIQRPVLMLLAGKRIRREGQRRGTKYFVGGARATSSSTSTGAAKKARAKRKPLSPAAKAKLRANLAKARAVRAAKIAKAK